MRRTLETGQLDNLLRQHLELVGEQVQALQSRQVAHLCRAHNATLEEARSQSEQKPHPAAAS